jgi:AraC-like DNA-binding protein
MSNTHTSSGNTGERLLTTDGLPWWGGFPIVVARSAERGTWAGEALSHFYLAVVLRGACAVDLRYGTKRRHVNFTPGCVAAYPAGQHWDSLNYEGAVESVNVSFDWSALGSLADEPAPTHQLSAVYACVTDESIVSLVKCLAREAADGGRSGRLYAESLCIALAQRVRSIADEGAGRKANKAESARFSPIQVRLIRSYIDAFLSEPLTVSALAGNADMSASHFAARFKATFGLPVHRYVVHERIRKAKELLQTGYEAAHVASACGFATQSHFTETFRRLEGITPVAYQKSRRRFSR